MTAEMFVLSSPWAETAKSSLHGSQQIRSRGLGQTLGHKRHFHPWSRRSYSRQENFPNKKKRSKCQTKRNETFFFCAYEQKFSECSLNSPNGSSLNVLGFFKRAHWRRSKLLLMLPNQQCATLWQVSHTVYSRKSTRLGYENYGGYPSVLLTWHNPYELLLPYL